MKLAAPLRLLLLSSKLGYQSRGFADAARGLGAEVVFATDRCHQLDDPWQDAAIPVHFEDPRSAARDIHRALASRSVTGILALGDRAILTAAHVARSLRIPYNSPSSVEACSSKVRQRRVLRAMRLPVPEFFSFGLDASLVSVLKRVRFPCVVKPLSLSASQGVIRANNPAEFSAAVERIRTLLTSPEMQVTRGPDLDQLLVESYIPGREVALEGLLEKGRLRILALFDKPDPLEGPYFEETIYVTPSRLPSRVQQSISRLAHRTIRTLGLTHGPLHVEFRVNEDGPWVLEAAPRPIGGLCSRVLRFGPRRILLEELLVRHALRLPSTRFAREKTPSGVMMIPVPQSGIFAAVEGLDAARSITGVDEIHITARLHDYIAAWPEGSTYLGFIFARGKKSEEVEFTLREAHRRLRFTFTPRLPVEHPATRRLPAIAKSRGAT